MRARLTSDPRAVSMLVPLLAAGLVTAGAAIPLVMMVNGSLALGIDYKWWTWPAIPAVWLPAMAGALLSTRRRAPGALLLVLASAAGVAVFRREYGLFTFGGAWLLGAYLYLEAGGGVWLAQRSNR
jgi:hypothetical protein